jgi:hypothetical protein
MHQHSPSVTRLQLHLPDQQRVQFDSDDPAGYRILDNETLRKTNLTEFFTACQTYPELTRNLTYPDFPLSFTWDVSGRRWKPRTRQPSLGRVYFAGPATGEL